MAFVAIVFREQSEIKDWFFRIFTLIVLGIYGYLLVYFFIFSGCEELIKYWVVGNLLIIVAFVVLRIFYAIATQGSSGLRSSLTKRPHTEN